MTDTPPNILLKEPSPLLKAQDPGETTTACPRCWNDNQVIVELDAPESLNKRDTQKYFRFPGEAPRPLMVIQAAYPVTYLCRKCSTIFREKLVLEVVEHGITKPLNWEIPHLGGCEGGSHPSLLSDSIVCANPKCSYRGEGMPASEQEGFCKHSRWGWDHTQTGPSPTELDMSRRCLDCKELLEPELEMVEQHRPYRSCGDENCRQCKL